MLITNIHTERLILKCAGSVVVQPGEAITVPNIVIEEFSDEIQPLVDANKISLTEFGSRVRFKTTDDDDLSGGIPTTSRNFVPTAIVFDQNVTYNAYAQSGATALTLAGSGHRNNARHILRVTGDGSNFSFSSDFVSIVDGTTQAATIAQSGAFMLEMIYNEALGKVLVQTFAASSGSGGGAAIFPVRFKYHGQLPASLTDFHLFTEDSVTDNLLNQYDLDLVSMKALVNGSISAGTITIKPRKSKLAIADASLDLALSSGTTYDTAKVADTPAAFNFTEDTDGLSVAVTTSGDLSPVTLSLSVELWVQASLGE